VHYRSAWYLDAWCHASDGLRRFALDAIREATLLEQRAKDVAVKTIEAELDAGYGVFSGGKVQWATLVFTPEAAQWVKDEAWRASDGCVEAWGAGAGGQPRSVGANGGGAIASSGWAVRLTAAALRITASYSITRSARKRVADETVRPSALAAFMLTTKSNVVGRSIGMSEGLAPLRILSTKTAARRYSARKFTP